jgi:hypothetical protein
VLDEFALPHQRRAPVVSGLVEERLDLQQREPELTPHEYLLKALQILTRVQPVPSLGALAWREQPDLVVMVERPHGHTRELRNLTNRLHAKNGMASRRVRVKALSRQA